MRIDPDDDGSDDVSENEHLLHDVVNLVDLVRDCGVDNYYDGSGGKGYYSWEWRTPGAHFETTLIDVPHLNSGHHPDVYRGESAEAYQCLLPVGKARSSAESTDTPCQDNGCGRGHLARRFVSCLIAGHGTLSGCSDNGPAASAIAAVSDRRWVGIRQSVEEGYHDQKGI